VNRLIVILLLLGAFTASAADLVFSNNAIICDFGDSFQQSDAAAGMVTGYRYPDYLESYFALNYPGANIHFYNFSRAGQNMGGMETNELEVALPLWAYQFNQYQHVGFIQPTDNGSLTSNQMFLVMSNMFQFPKILFDAVLTGITQTGWGSTNTFQWVTIGDPPGAAADGGAVGTQSVMARNAGSTNAGFLLGWRGIDAYNVMSNSWVTDYNANGGTNVQMVFPSGVEHWLAAGGLSWALHSTLPGITTDTNIALCTVDWNGSIVSTNHCVVSSAGQSANRLTFTRHDDRLPMAFDVPDGTITNDARPCFALNPSDANFFHFDLKLTNLPAGNYLVEIDGQNVATLSDTVLAAGWNMFTNYAGPYWAQRKEVLGRIRDKNHCDRVSLVPQTVNHHGMFSYFADTIGHTETGDALITSSLTNNVADILALDALTAAAAVPTNHVFVITRVVTPIGTMNSTTATMGTVHIGG
jgi:hypothetical protein